MPTRQVAWRACRETRRGSSSKSGREALRTRGLGPRALSRFKGDGGGPRQSSHVTNSSSSSSLSNLSPHAVSFVLILPAQESLDIIYQFHSRISPVVAHLYESSSCFPCAHHFSPFSYILGRVPCSTVNLHFREMQLDAIHNKMALTRSLMGDKAGRLPRKLAIEVTCPQPE